MTKLTFPLNDPAQIFGNDAAEDEPDPVFESYALYRGEVATFKDASRPLQVARAYKGEGKSALLRLVETGLSRDPTAPIIIKTTGQNISPSIDSSDSDQWVREWARKILHRIACEIGARLSFAYSDDAISLVEEAERNNFKQRSFVSTVTDRLKSKYIPLERERIPVADPQPLLKRWLSNGSTVWVFIDDLDQNFKNETAAKLKVASCFIAVRQIFTQIPEIKFRLAVRPNVWSIIKREFEALSHVEQYMVDLPWSDGMFLDLLQRRVEGYLKRSDQWSKAEVMLSGTSDVSDARYERVEGFLFESPITWGGSRRPMHVALHTLSCHRPRWLIELCKVSAAEAQRKKHNLILLEDVLSQLEAFGKKRIEDMTAEFTSQCPQIEDLIFAFSGYNERYNTGDLLKTIETRVLQQVRPAIVGIGARPTHREVAQFLFQIGFLSARRDHSDGRYDHLAFRDRPNLLKVNTNLDEGCSWEIHPVFRRTLRLQDVKSKSELARDRGRRR